MNGHTLWIHAYFVWSMYFKFDNKAQFLEDISDDVGHTFLLVVSRNIFEHVLKYICT